MTSMSTGKLILYVVVGENSSFALYCNSLVPVLFDIASSV